MADESSEDMLNRLSAMYPHIPLDVLRDMILTEVNRWARLKRDERYRRVV
jgi:hypothetical protein